MLGGMKKNMVAATLPPKVRARLSNTYTATFRSGGDTRVPWDEWIFLDELCDLSGVNHVDDAVLDDGTEVVVLDNGLSMSSDMKTWAFYDGPYLEGRMFDSVSWSLYSPEGVLLYNAEYRIKGDTDMLDCLAAMSATIRHYSSL